MSKRPDKISEGLGEKEGFSKLKMKLVNHKSAEFETDNNKFEIELTAGEDVKVLTKLVHYDSEGQEKEVERAVFMHVDDKELTFHVAVRETGWYKLNIFAAPISQSGDSLPGVFTYLFHVTRIKEQAPPYPRQFADWKQGCHLYEPLTIDKSANLEKVKFKVKVPGAKKVAVKAGEEWTRLEEDGGKWKGVVRLREHFEKKENVLISLNANMGGPDGNSYATLLQFSTQP